MQASIWIGFDPREAASYAVTRDSVQRRLRGGVSVHGLVLADLKAQGLYWRPTERREGRLWDVISEAPCATEFSISRFLVPHLARQRLATLTPPAWALFMDGDMLANADLGELFDQADERYAVMCVKHQHDPAPGLKMDDQLQTAYARKNWSSLTLWNLHHPSNQGLSVEIINTVPGRDLHRFFWLRDEEIGELSPVWNWFASFGVPDDGQPKVTHFTDGTPEMKGYEEQPFADEWRAALARWAV
jgi:hypothetical protein